MLSREAVGRNRIKLAAMEQSNMLYYLVYSRLGNTCSKQCVAEQVFATFRIFFLLQRCDKEPEIVLLGNKRDLPEASRKVANNEAKEVRRLSLRKHVIAICRDF